ncbi:hypothetical protein AVDCRST_MAG82-1262, partial [uncultured Rubrobacteraceae bacterium]
TAGTRNVLRTGVDDLDPLEALSRYYGSAPKRARTTEAAQGVLI